MEYPKLNLKLFELDEYVIEAYCDRCKSLKPIKKGRCTRCTTWIKEYMPFVSFADKFRKMNNDKCIPTYESKSFLEVLESLKAGTFNEPHHRVDPQHPYTGKWQLLYEDTIKLIQEHFEVDKAEALKFIRTLRFYWHGQHISFEGSYHGYVLPELFDIEKTGLKIEQISEKKFEDIPQPKHTILIRKWNELKTYYHIVEDPLRKRVIKLEEKIRKLDKQETHHHAVENSLLKRIIELEEKIRKSDKQETHHHAVESLLKRIIELEEKIRKSDKQETHHHAVEDPLWKRIIELEEKNKALMANLALINERFGF